MTVSARGVVRLAALAAILSIGAAPAAGAHAAGSAKLRPPTLLWKSYPLVQQPRVGASRKTAASPRKEASGPATAPGRQFDEMLLLTALAVGTVVFLRGPTTVRVGGSLRGRGGARTPRPARRPQPRRRQARGYAPPAAPEIASDIAVEPREQEPTRLPAPPPAPPDDDLERALDDLLEALQPHTQSERAPELELRELIMRKNAAPESTHPWIEPEIDAALERIATRRALEAQARKREAKTASLARSEVRLWHGYVKSQLYVTMSGSEHAVAVSQHFRMRENNAPGPQAQDALASLLAQLEGSGWKVVAHGPKWYDRTLELFASDSRRDDTETPVPDEDGLPKVVYRAVSNQDDKTTGRET
jgi:hypothetical protein